MTQPRAPDRRLKRHREVLAIACVVCLLAFLLHELPDGRVAVRGLPQFPLPQTCASRAWLGIRCPGCGLTRSIIHLAEGDWQASWRAPPARRPVRDCDSHSRSLTGSTPFAGPGGPCCRTSGWPRSHTP